MRHSDKTPPIKLHIWRNTAEEFWAFEDLYPTEENGDPAVFGNPIGYALVKQMRFPVADMIRYDTLNECVSILHNCSGDIDFAMYKMEALIEGNPYAKVKAHES